MDARVDVNVMWIKSGGWMWKYVEGTRQVRRWRMECGWLVCGKWRHKGTVHNLITELCGKSGVNGVSVGVLDVV